jgi:hypothetical protein
MAHYRGWRVPSPVVHSWRSLFIAGLGIGQIASWGTLYYSFPLIAERMGQDLGLSKPEVTMSPRFGRYRPCTKTITQIKTTLPPAAAPAT